MGFRSMLTDLQTHHPLVLPVVATSIFASGFVRQVLDQPEPEHSSPDQHVDKKRSEYRSLWKKAIRLALMHLGKDASYQAIATWMSEQIHGLELPEYCQQEGEEKGRADLGFLCRNNSSVRARFQKDITKVKKDL